MPTAQERGSANPPRSFRLRPDLQWSLYDRDSSDDWVLHDPVSLENFYFSDSHRKLIVAIDSGQSIQEIAKSQRLGKHESEALLDTARQLASQMANAGLLVQAQTHLRPLRKRPNGLRRLLGFQIRLFHPGPLLDWLTPRSSWLFSRVAFRLWIVLTLISLLGIAIRFDQFTEELQQLPQQGIGESIAIATSVWILLKIFHELGHAVACRRMGVSCPEIGVTFYLFIPCFYCDVSESWRLDKAWKRASIAAAGIYVEWWIAILAFAVWWFTSSSWSHFLALHVLIVASVNTLLVNANPLLRFDGYYIFSDSLRITNLAEHADWSFRYFISRLLTLRLSIRDLVSSEGLLASYHIAGSIYRYSLLVGICLTIYYYSSQLHLQYAGLLLAGFLMLSTAWAPVGFLLSCILLSIAPDPTGVHRGARLLSGVLILGILACLFVPLPSFVTADATIQLGEFETLYAEQSGYLVEGCESSKRVAPKSAIAIMRSPDLELRAAETTLQKRLLEQQIQSASRRAVDDQVAASDIESLEVDLQRLTTQEQFDTEAINQLTCTSQNGGVAILATQNRRLMKSKSSKEELLGLSGTLLSTSNRGGWIERGTLIATIDQSGERVLEIRLPESYLSEVQAGNTVRCKLLCSPSKVLTGKVVSISSQPVTVENANDQEQPVQQRERPETYFLVRAKIDQSTIAPIGSRGVVHLMQQPSPLVQQLGRWLVRVWRDETDR